jgi:ADP-heptose:LPS heptosyltransferase
MRSIDRWLGGAVCAGLTLVRRVADLIRPAPQPEIRRIAFVKLAEQGATVLAHAAIRKATQWVGRENVFFVVFEENRFILDVMDVIPQQNVIAIRTNGMHRLVGDALRAVRRLRRERVDAAVDFEFFARSSAALAYLSGAPHRAGFHAFGGEAWYRGDLMTHRVSYNPHLHASQHFQILVDALGVPQKRLPAFDLTPPPSEIELPRLQPSVTELEDVRRSLRVAFGRDEIPPLVLLNANCGDLLPLRRWPSERYTRLARNLLERFPEIGIAFTGGPSERDGAQELVDQLKSDRCVNMAGRTTLRQLLVLYCLAEVLVTNDSGPAHFATLTPIDVVTLFGPETPAAFGARTPRSHILWSGVVCSPCVNAYNDRQSACTDNVCMQRITLDEVFDRVCSVYEGRRQRILAEASRDAADVLPQVTHAGAPSSSRSPSSASVSTSSGRNIAENRR